MKQKIEFDKGMIIEGNWTEDQKEVIKELVKQVGVVLKKRFPSLADHIKLKDHMPDQGVGLKITADLNFNEEMHLGELQNLHLLETIRDRPEETKKILRAISNDVAVLTYYNLLHKVIEQTLGYVTKRAEEEGLQDKGRFFVKNKKVIPLPFIPEDVVLMHPNTIKNLKRDIR